MLFRRVATDGFKHRVAIELSLAGFAIGVVDRAVLDIACGLRAG